MQEIDKLHILPSTAIREIPNSLSQETKCIMLRKTQEELAIILAEVIEQIDRGSIERIDTLVRRALDFEKL